MNKNDLRYVKTEHAITEAFLQCLQECALEKISISMICDRAMISRNTFYLHYPDKYALLQHLFNGLEQDIQARAQEDTVKRMEAGSFYEPVRWYIGFVAENRTLLKVLLPVAEQEFRQLLQRLFVDELWAQVYSGYDEKRQLITSRIICCYMVDGMVGFAKTWLEDFDSLDEEAAIALMMKLCTVPATLYIKNIQ